MNYDEESLKRHRELKGKLEIRVKAPIETIDDLSTFYTPGIAAVSRAIAEDQSREWEYTGRGNLVAVVSDGSAVLGLGNIGPAAAQPVMAGKAALFKEFAGVDAIPIVLATQNVDEIITTVRTIAPSFGGINLEDISAPHCFTIENALQDLGIPVMHDDQHGTAVVVLAGLINSTKILGRPLNESKMVINGAGAAGTAIAIMLQEYAPGIEVVIVDSKGIVVESREDLNDEKRAMAARTNPNRLEGSLADALIGAHIFIGVSVAGALHAELIRTMAPDPIIFAMANPVPEVYPDEARAAGAAIVATGRSDFPNQVNNVLVFPGIFRGALDAHATRITRGMFLAAAEALAHHIAEPNREHILPSPLDKGVACVVAEAVANAARSDGVIRPNS